jgi:hypothetical protein
MNLYIRAVAGSASSAFGRNDECNDDGSDSGADVATETVIMVAL